MFGGLSSSGTLLNDVWSFSFSSLTWRRAQATQPPSPRYLHVAFVSGASDFCVFGGSEAVLVGGPLSVVSAAPPTVSCLSTAAPDGAFTSESPSGAVSVVAATVADAGSSAVVFGGVSNSRSLQQSVQSFSLSLRTWSSTPTFNVRAYAAGARSFAGLMWQFGGLDTANQSTFVLASGPGPVWAPVTTGCEAGFSGSQCQTPVCRNNCWGVGRCIAPDLCECFYGFSGALCSQQQCTTCGIGMLPLNQPVYWPRAHTKSDTCIDTLSNTIRQILALLPPSPETCAEKNTLATPLNLTAVSKAAWDFRIGASKSLVETTAQTLQLLKQ